MKKHAGVLVLSVVLAAGLVVSALAADESTSPPGNMDLEAQVGQDSNLISVAIPTTITFAVVVDADNHFIAKTSSTLGEAWEGGKDIVTGVMTATNAQVRNNSAFPVKISAAAVDDSVSGLLDLVDLAIVPTQYGMPVPALDPEKPMEEQKDEIKRYQIYDGDVNIVLLSALSKDDSSDTVTGKADNHYLWAYGLPKIQVDGQHPTFTEGAEYTVKTTLKVEKIS